MVDGGESGNDREGINGVQDCFNPARNIGLLMSSIPSVRRGDDNDDDNEEKGECDNNGDQEEQDIVVCQL